MKKKEIEKFFPRIPSEDKKLIKNLPESFLINDVPYIKQEEKHLSGSAAYQMLMSFDGQSFPSQKEIAKEAGWDDFKKFNHATYKENFEHFLIKNGKPSYHLYPANFIATKLSNGIEATQIIRSNSEIISNIDFKIFKALLVKIGRPQLVRLHFTTDIYPMEEEMAKYIDMSGHCVLLIGYDEDGFIFNDPWDKETWGGTRGGKEIKISYHELINIFQMVNYSKDNNCPNGRVLAEIPTPSEVCLTDDHITLNTKLIWEGILGYSLIGIKINNISVELKTDKNLIVIGDNPIKISEDFYPGGSLNTKWILKTGSDALSHPVEVLYTVDYHYPEIPWEGLKAIKMKFTFKSKNRVCLFDSSYLINAGITSDDK
ncbi:MAG: C39 family peptidase [Vicingaceae bacterium]|nr:C39 family peptidase [Vicingaceae bacterium]